MMFLVVLSAVLALAVAETYESTYDIADLEAVISNPEVLKAITQCFLDQGPCSEQVAVFKKVLPEVVQQACAKCTPAQKQMLRRYIEVLKNTFPEDLKFLSQKYDPEGKYMEALRAAIGNA